MNNILPFIEPRVEIKDLKQVDDFDNIATRLGLSGYVLFNIKYSEKSKYKGKNNYLLEHISRYEIKEDSVTKVKKKLPKVRHDYELISIQTSSAKIAQWVVKDNRIDILCVPMKSMKGIITHQLANVATKNELFIEIDLSPIIFDKIKNKSIYLRQLTRILNILIIEKTPFIFTCNVKNPLMFRSKRAIQSFVNVIGIPEKIFKDNIQKFYSRVETNQKKLSGKMKSPGIWVSNEKKTKNIKKKIKSSETNNLYDSIKGWKISSLKEKKLERQRYFLFEILTTKNEIITEKQFLDQFWKTFTDYFGIIYSSKSGVFISRYDETAKIGILRCSHKTIHHVRSVLAFITSINKIDVLIHVIRVSGTMKKLIEKSKKKNEK